MKRIKKQLKRDAKNIVKRKKKQLRHIKQNIVKRIKWTNTRVGRCVCANTVLSFISTRMTDALDVFN